MKIGSKLQKFWTWLQRLLLFLILSLISELECFGCLRDEFWTSLNSHRGLKMNLRSFPFSAELKKETALGFLKANTTMPGTSAATLSLCPKRLTSQVDRFVRILPAS